MGIQTKRVRTNGTGAVATLDLTSAVAANRRLDVAAPGDADGSSVRMMGFTWQKTTAQATDIQVYKIDQLNGNKAYLLAQRLGDTNQDGNWRPTAEEYAGEDALVPPASGAITSRWLYRLQFSQAGGACSVDITAEIKAVN